MSQTRNDKVSLSIGIPSVDQQVELVQHGLQSKVRAIMAIYGIDRAEAEKVIEEIMDENA